MSNVIKGNFKKKKTSWLKYKKEPLDLFTITVLSIAILTWIFMAIVIIWVP